MSRALLLLAATLAGPRAVATDGGERIAGLRGFSAHSRVVFDAEPEAPHRLEVVYSFPDRARWLLGLRTDADGERLVEYRDGERAYGLFPGEATSVEYAGEDRAVALRRFELRRAAMLWPDGFDWQDTPDGRRAALRAADGVALGSLVATPAEGRPLRFAALDPRGEEQESLEVESWQRADEREWPRVLRLSAAGAGVWRETVERIDTRGRWLPTFFVPADRRTSTGSARLAPGVSRTELAPARVRRLELAPELGWEAAWKAAERALSAEQRRLEERGSALDGVARIELDGELRPAFALAFLAEDAAAVDGYAEGEGREALTTLVPGPAVPRSAADELLRSVPEGARPLPAYVRRLDGGGPQTGLQVVLPLAPGEGG